MLPVLEALARRYPLLLTCVTSAVVEIEELLAPQCTGPSSPLRVRFVQWQPNLMDAELAGCDLVLIPSEYRDPVKRAKSPNRLVAGLHAGRLVVAHPLSAYEPYAPYAWIGEDLCEGIEWAARNPQEPVARIAPARRSSTSATPPKPWRASGSTCSTRTISLGNREAQPRLWRQDPSGLCQR